MHKIKTLALALLLAQGAAHAMSVASDTAFAGGQVITFNGYDGLLSTGPEDVGAEVGVEVILTSGPFTEIGANARDLGENGLWGARGNPVDGLVATPTGSGNFVASSFGNRQGMISFSFTTAVAGVGAFMNQYQQDGVVNNLTLLAFDASGNTLETFTYSTNTASDSYNEGKFLGFQRTTADIYGFGVAGKNIALDDLRFSATPVPEADTYAMLLAGLGVVGLIARRRRQK